MVDPITKTNHSDAADRVSTKLWFFLAALLVLLTGCTPKIAIGVDEQQPMTFVLARGQWWSSPRNSIRATGIKVTQVGSTEPNLVWQLQPGPGFSPDKTGLSRLSLGTIPDGYIQIYPKDNIPASFVDGAQYELVILGDGLGVVRFRIDDKRIVDLQRDVAVELPKD